MKNQPGESPGLVVLKLDNGELAEDRTHHETSVSEPGAGRQSWGMEGAGPSAGVDSHGLPAELVEVDPSTLSPRAQSRRARHPSTDLRSHPARIEEEI